MTSGLRVGPLCWPLWWSVCGSAWLQTGTQWQTRGPLLSGICGMLEEALPFLQPAILMFRVILLAGGESQQTPLTLVNMPICHFGREDTRSSKGWGYQLHKNEFQWLKGRKGEGYGEPTTRSCCAVSGVRREAPGSSKMERRRESRQRKRRWARA